jgi:excisionase family DNA binding protein
MPPNTARNGGRVVDMVTISELVRRSKLGRRTIERAIRRGDLAAVRVGTRVLITTEAATSWLTRSPVKPVVPAAPVEVPHDRD